MNVPASTYRIQLNRDFTFRDLKGIIPYLHELGITTIYAAPIFSATPGSMHGYDVVDPHAINPEIGSESELNDISTMLRERGMTWLQDIVPNHMAFVTQNWP
jgi:(1->4)-alpha-D-glucan 1-alpha-D-glucosylmutase